MAPKRNPADSPKKPTGTRTGKSSSPAASSSLSNKGKPKETSEENVAKAGGAGSIKASQPTATTKPKAKAQTYAPPQCSILAEYVFFPFYDSVVKLYPATLTPNCITVFGILCTLAASILFLLTMPQTLLLSSRPGAPLDVPVVGRSELLSILGQYDLATDATASFFREGAKGSSDSMKDTQLWLAGQRQRRSLYAEAGHPITGFFGQPVTLFTTTMSDVLVEAQQMLNGSSLTTSAKSRPRRAVDFTRLDQDNSGNYYPHLIKEPTGRLALCLKLLSVRLVEVLFSQVRLLVQLFSNRDAGSDQPAPPIYPLLSKGTAAMIQSRITALEQGFLSLLRRLLGLMDEMIAASKGISQQLAFRARALLGPWATDFLSSPGRVLLVVIGVLNLIYCIADNTDGRHARRSKQCSCIGEYLDHGLDCITAFFSTFIVIIIGDNEPRCGAFGVLLLSVVTMLCHVIHQEKDIMIWGNRLISVDEAMIGFASLPLIFGLVPGLITVPLSQIGKQIAALYGQYVLKNNNSSINPLLALGAYLPPSIGNILLPEVLFFVFMLSQMSVAMTMIRMSKSVVTRPVVMILFCQVFVFFVLTNHYPVPRSGGEPLASLFATEAPSTALNHGRPAALPYTLDNFVFHLNHNPLTKNIVYDSILVAGKTSQHYVTSAVLKAMEIPVPGALADNGRVLLLRDLAAPLLTLIRLLEGAMSLLFSYEALWVITASSCASILIHLPIYAKCLGIRRGAPQLLLWVFVLPAITLTFFFFSPQIAALNAATAHFLQILYNIQSIKRHNKH